MKGSFAREGTVALQKSWVNFAQNGVVNPCDHDNDYDYDYEYEYDYVIILIIMLMICPEWCGQPYRNNNNNATPWFAHNGVSNQ